MFLSTWILVGLYTGWCGCLQINLSLLLLVKAEEDGGRVGDVDVAMVVAIVDGEGRQVICGILALRSPTIFEILRGLAARADQVLFHQICDSLSSASIRILKRTEHCRLPNGWGLNILSSFQEPHQSDLKLSLVIKRAVFSKFFLVPQSFYYTVTLRGHSSARVYVVAELQDMLQGLWTCLARAVLVYDSPRQ